MNGRGKLKLSCRAIVFIAVVAANCPPQCAATEPELLELSGDLGIHDPCMIKAGDTYYLFATGGRRGRGIMPDPRLDRLARVETCRIRVRAASRLGRRGSAACPQRLGAGYLILQRQVSSLLLTLVLRREQFGNRAGHEQDARSKQVRLINGSTRGLWSARAGEDDFNAIDPNFVIEDKKNIWLAWGSFWGGIMMRRIDPQTGKLSADDTTLHKLAARPRNDEHNTPPVEGAIEAPFIVRHGDYWYHFVSWDFCCRGARSNYKVVVGRSPKLTGPYFDKAGKPMSDDGGTLLIEAATDKWRGAGHPAVYQENGTDYLLFHAYSADTGRPRLHISTLVWEDGWPRVAKMP